LVEAVVKAVHDTDLEKVLRKLGLYEKLLNGELRCAICGSPLTLEDLGGLYRMNGEIKLVCGRIQCLVEAAEKLRAARQSQRKRA